MTIIQRADLACREGSKDAVYHIQIVQREGGYTVDYQNGRRGSTLQSGTKTKAPVTLEVAQKSFDKVVREKMTASPAYRPIAGQGDAATQSQAMTQVSAEMAQRQTGLVAQLLERVYEDALANLVHDDNVVAQQKLNGERRFIQLLNNGLPAIGANRRGLEVPLEPELAMSVAGIHCTLDGEIIGSHLYAFDLMELEGRDLKPLPYRERKRLLDSIAPRFGARITVVQDAFTAQEKRELLARVTELGQEGVVYKRLDDPYGEPQIKFKLIDDATVVVLRHKEDKRSVEMGVYEKDGPMGEKGRLIPVGFVTIPPNHAVPALNSLIDVEYLYAYEGGSLFQPVYQRQRTDLESTAASLSQLKFKVEHCEVLVESNPSMSEAPRLRA